MSTQAHMPQLLQSRQEAISAEWYRTLAKEENTSLTGESLRQCLHELTGKAIAVLLEEADVDTESRAVGAALADLHLIRPDALGQTVGILGSHFVAELPDDQAVAIQPTLAALLEGLSTGFVERARSMVLAEQESIRRDLVLELKQTEQALWKTRDELEVRVARRTAA
jgi:hypothetical protein